MSSQPLLTNPLTNVTTDRSSSRDKRRRKKFHLDQNQKPTHDNLIHPWKSEVQQEIYSSKLLQALRHVRRSSASNTTGAGNSKRSLRETADRVLAVTAKGRTRWSRAILTNKLKIKGFKRNRRERGMIVSSTVNSRLKKPKVSILRLKMKSLPAVQRKGRVLGGLVPGCRKQSLPVVLEEATDYIPALEMQVKAMAALVELLSGGSGSSSGSGGGGGDLSLFSFRPPGRL